MARSAPESINLEAQLARSGGGLTSLYRLTVAAAGDYSVTVKEGGPDRLLPAACPDRHINAGGTFCIGLRAGRNIQTASDAKVWWEQLGVFLLAQQTATETGFWPPDLQLSHGDEAADLQIQAEALAERLGKTEEYREAVAFNSGPFADLAGNFSRVTNRPFGGSKPCVCGRKDRTGRVKKRSECAAEDGACLVALEAKRRREVDRFWQRHVGVACCETMQTCPLRSRG